MYESFFGMTHKPFTALPDPEFLVESPEHVAALSTLEYAIKSQAGFCVITGEIGCGKTTLVHALLRRLDDQVAVGIIPNTYSSFRNMARWALMAFDQRPVGQTAAEHYQELMLFLIAEYGRGRHCLLIVDEA